MIILSDQFERLDWRVRSSFACVAALLSVAMLILSVQATVNGTWLFAPILAGAAALLITLARSGWKLKLSGSLGRKVERLGDIWKERRAKATKTQSGKLVWNACRALFGGWLAWQITGLAPELSIYVRWIAAFGFGVSFGFWGLEAAIWAGIGTGVAGQLLAQAGLGVNLADPGTRDAYQGYWQGGSIGLSWSWPIALTLLPFVWIGLAASMSAIRQSLIAEIDHRLKVAADKKRIELRRQRYQERSAVGGNTELEAARARYESAQDRLKALTADSEVAAAGGVAMADTALALKGASAASSLMGSEMEMTFKRYADHIKHVHHGERIGVPDDEALRRAFDRTLIAMTDEYVDHLRSSNSADHKLILDYFNALSALEQSIGTPGPGDGEIVTTQTQSETVAQGEDNQDNSEVAVNLDDYNSNVDFNNMPDALDGPVGAKYIAGSRQSAMATKLLPLTLSNGDKPAFVVGEDGTPKGSGVIPVGQNGGNDSDPSNPSAPSEGNPSYEGVTDTVDQSTNAASSDATGQRGSPDQATASDAPADNASDAANTSVAADAATDGIDDQTGSHAKPAPDTADEPAKTRGATDSGADDDATEAAARAGVDPAELREAAVLILQGQTGRDFVLQHRDTFADADAVGVALGVGGSVVQGPFSAFSEKVAAAGLEAALTELLDGELATIELVTSAVDRLVAAEWDHDPALVVRAQAWIERVTREAEQERERAAAAERERLEAIAAAEAEQAAKVEAERAAAEAAEAAAEAERIAAIKEEEARQLRAAREALRQKYAAHILLGKLDENSLTDGAELFPTVEDLATTLQVDREDVIGAFEAFQQKHHAFAKFAELEAAFRDQDLNTVEALLATPESFDGYQHPRVNLDLVRGWVQSEKERHRLSGLIEATGVVPEAGGDIRRLFMRKRLGLSDDVANVIESDLPAQLRIVASLRNALTLIGANAPEGIRAPLEEAEAKARGYAALVVEKRDGKDVAREYVQAFLPGDVRRQGEDPWKMLTDLAGGVDPLQPVVAAAEVMATTKSGASPDNVEAERIGNIAVSFNNRRTLEEVQTLDYNHELRDIITNQKVTRNIKRALGQIEISLKGHYGNNLEHMVQVNDNSALASIRNPQGDVIGQVKIGYPFLAQPVWFDPKMKDREVVIYSDEAGRIASTSSRRIEQSFKSEISAPNGSSETVIAYIALSAMLTEDGRTSLEPFVESMNGPFAIFNLAGNSDVVEFLRELEARNWG